MSWEAERLVVVAVVLAGAAALAWWFRLKATRRGEPVDVGSLGLASGAVVFTRDQCSNCARVMRLVEELAIPIRQVRIEEEPEVFERLGVTAVPLTVVTDTTGSSRYQFAGVPSLRSLRRAARRA